MEVNKLVESMHEISKSKGWHDKERSPLEMHALMHSEISEATEEVRNNKPYVYQIEDGKIISTNFKDNLKPEGEAIELVDCVIRIMDYFGYRKWDLEKLLTMKMQYNNTRSHRHGGKAY